MTEKLVREISIVIPTRNDEVRICENIDYLIEYFDTNSINYEIIIVSNGSTISSIKKINNILDFKQNVKHIVLKEPGKGLAIRQGIKSSKHDLVLFTDADCSVSIDHFSYFCKENSLMSPLVIGNRKNKLLSEDIDSPFYRRITGFGYINLINFLFSLNIEDTQCGFKAIDKKLFNECIQFKTDGFSFDLELIVLAKLNNIEITEVPVKYVHNKNSKVKPIKHTILMFFEVFKIYYWYRKASKNYKKRNE